MNKPVSFELAKLLKEKECDKTSHNFYTKPNSKMFGLDEHGMAYSIKNTSKKLYTIGEHASLNDKNVYYAPTIADVVMWLYEKHDIWIHVCDMVDTNNWWWDCYKYKTNGLLNLPAFSHKFNYQSPTEAYEAAIEYLLNNLL